jgi:hypothetical protein
MDLTVNKSLNASANVANVFAGNEQRQTRVQDDKRPTTAAAEGIRGNNQVIRQLDNDRNKLLNNQPNFRNNVSSRAQQAVDAYQSQQNEQRRAEIQLMLGVDLYA